MESNNNETKTLSVCSACREMIECDLSFDETHSTMRPGFLMVEDEDKPGIYYIPDPHVIKTVPACGFDEDPLVVINEYVEQFGTPGTIPVHILIDSDYEEIYYSLRPFTIDEGREVSDNE